MSSHSDDDDDLALGGVFTEPPRPPTPPPTFASYTRERGADSEDAEHGSDAWPWPRDTLELSLVGSHPLWGHFLWNAARAVGAYLDANPALYRARSVLELGAGGGLPSIVCALNGAKYVVTTDYPDTALLENLQENVTRNCSGSPSLPGTDRTDAVRVMGHIWGKPIQPLLEAFSDSSSGSKGPVLTGFDVIILSDLIFNHSQHDAMLSSCEAALTSEISSSTTTTSSHPPCVLVFYSHHRPHLADRDMEFFARARERGWVCERVLEQRFEPMFPDDIGAKEVRATVHGWRLTRGVRTS